MKKKSRFNNTRMLLTGALGGFIVTESDKVALKVFNFPIFSLMFILGIITYGYLESKDKGESK